MAFCSIRWFVFLNINKKLSWYSADLLWNGWWLIHAKFNTTRMNTFCICFVNMHGWWFIDVNINTSTVNALCGFVVDMDDHLSCQHQHHNCQYIPQIVYEHGWWLIHVNINRKTGIVFLLICHENKWWLIHVKINTSTGNALCGWVVGMGLLPDTQNCGLRMRRECRECFPLHH